MTRRGNNYIWIDGHIRELVGLLPVIGDLSEPIENPEMPPWNPTVADVTELYKNGAPPIENCEHSYVVDSYTGAPQCSICGKFKNDWGEG